MEVNGGVDCNTRLRSQFQQAVKRDEIKTEGSEGEREREHFLPMCDVHLMPSKQSHSKTFKTQPFNRNHVIQPSGLETLKE